MHKKALALVFGALAPSVASAAIIVQSFESQSSQVIFSALQLNPPIQKFNPLLGTLFRIDFDWALDTEQLGRDLLYGRNLAATPVTITADVAFSAYLSRVYGVEQFDILGRMDATFSGSVAAPPDDGNMLNFFGTDATLSRSLFSTNFSVYGDALTDFVGSGNVGFSLSIGPSSLIPGFVSSLPDVDYASTSGDTNFTTAFFANPIWGTTHSVSMTYYYIPVGEIPEPTAAAALLATLILAPRRRRVT